MMGIQEFGDALIRTRDLDPVYCGLVGAQLPRDQLARWLLAYWCYYSVGSASYISEHAGADYWDMMTQAAENRVGPRLHLEGAPERWPRAAERRHFRGEKCVRAVEWLRANTIDGRPESYVGFLATAETEKQVMSIVQGWPMFGPWVAFKAADMMERVWGTKLSVSPNIGLVYEAPRATLDLLAEQGGDGVLCATGRSAQWWYDNLRTYFSARKAPPANDRCCGPMECETIFCKWGSYRGGHYHIGKDIHEQREALAGWGETAGKLLAAYPPEVTQ